MKKNSLAELTLPECRLNLDGIWDFRFDTDGVGENEQWFSGNDESEWGDLHVPGCWQSQGLDVDYHGVAWYRHSFAVPDNWADNQVWLNFEGVSTYARVWVNGQYAGEHIGKWSPFALNVTGMAKPGDVNVVVVRVDEMPKHFSAGFFVELVPHFGGIWQSVSLYSTGALHIDDIFVHPNLASGLVDVDIETSGDTHQLSIARSS